MGLHLIAYLLWYTVLDGFGAAAQERRAKKTQTQLTKIIKVNEIVVLHDFRPTFGVPTAVAWCPALPSSAPTPTPLAATLYPATAAPPLPDLAPLSLPPQWQTPARRPRRYLT